MSGLYQSAIDQALEKVSVGIFSSLQRLAQAYLQADRQQWTRTAPGGGGGTIADVAGLSLSSGATELFMQLSHNMAVTAKELHPRLFRQLWRPLLGQQLDDLLYRKVGLDLLASACGGFTYPGLVVSSPELVHRASGSAVDHNQQGREGRSCPWFHLVVE